MPNMLVTLGAINGLVSVGAGASGAPVLKERVDARSLEIFETAARYQMYHALALFAVAWAVERAPGQTGHRGGWVFVAGTVIFSGTLYALSLTGMRWLGAITPLGGLAFMAGWLSLAMAFRRG